MVVIFTSPHYYLTVGICTILCYAIDLFIVAFMFNIRTKPEDLLRRVIGTKKNIKDRHNEFEALYRKVKKENIEYEIKREEYLERKR
jgi:hypothetical protein